MQTLSIKVRKIGNSKGIVIPQKILKLVENDREEITMEIDEQGILLKMNDQNPRKKWATSFKKMAKNNDDKLIVPDVFEGENVDEWK
jgi:antitoxin MazE